MLTTNQKGAIAEPAITFRGVEARHPRAPADTDGHRYDIVFDLGSRFLRVQCKWAVRHGDVISRALLLVIAGRADGLPGGYTADEVDALAAYCAEVDRCYLIPVALRGGATSSSGLPRRETTSAGVNWARSTSSPLHWSPSRGHSSAGRARAGSQEVAGSSPAGSIDRTPA